jgi:hypothetical protein
MDYKKASDKVKRNVFLIGIYDRMNFFQIYYRTIFYKLFEVTQQKQESRITSQVVDMHIKE